MNKRVERHFLDSWIDDNYPNAVTKLSVKSGVSASTIAKIRLGYVPKNRDVRRYLCSALGLEEEVVFPGNKILP